MDSILDVAAAAQDSVVTQFETYEEYLDSQVTPKDLMYLEDEDLARALVELGYAGSGETLSREDFYKRKETIELSRQQKLRAQPKALASAGKDLSNFPLLQALANREEMVRNGKLTVRHTACLKLVIFTLYRLSFSSEIETARVKKSADTSILPIV